MHKTSFISSFQLFDFKSLDHNGAILELHQGSSSCHECLKFLNVFIQACGRKEEVRYLLWIRLSRVRKLTNFFQNMEKDIRINYLFTRIVKLTAVELYCTHTAACIFYYLATTLPSSEEGYTWIGSLKMGDYSYSHFREIDIWKRYVTSLYFAIVTMATVGKYPFVRHMVLNR